MLTLKSISRSLVSRSVVFYRPSTRNLCYTRVNFSQSLDKDHVERLTVIQESAAERDDSTADSPKKEPTDYKAIDEYIKASPLRTKETTLEDLRQSGRFHKYILQGLKLAKFETLTPVQEKSMIPIIDEEKGLVVRAKTGTGKTLAFVVPTLQYVFDNYHSSKRGNGKIYSLVIAPTRDLALQIEAEYKKVLKHLPKQVSSKARIAVIMGGRKTEINAYYPPSIVIATPGRLEDKLRNPKFAQLFSELKYRVYDEADRILDQGFKDTLDNIDSMLREARNSTTNDSDFKSVLFSATVDDSVSDFAVKTIGRDYKFIDCVDKDEAEAHENIAQTLVKTNSVYESFNGSMSFVINNMNRKYFKAIIFLPTIAGTDWYYSMINDARHKGLFDTDLTKRYGSRILKLHGKMSQAARDRTVKEFRRIAHGVLICTDVAARGLDFNDVSDVVQMCPSTAVADYIHKIGRTARAGARGKSILFLSDYEKRYKRALEVERGIKFAEEINYYELEEFNEDVLKKIGVCEPEAETFIQTLLSFHKQIASVYKLPKDKMLHEVFNFYRLLLQDPNAKLNVTNNYLSNVLNIHPRDAKQYFEVPGGFNSYGSNSRQSKKTFMNDYSRDRKSDFNRNNKGGFRNQNQSRGRKNYGSNYSGSKNHDSRKSQRNDYGNNDNW